VEPGFERQQPQGAAQTVTIGHVLLLIDFVGTWKICP
jgi:hypothetical protein